MIDDFEHYLISYSPDENSTSLFQGKLLELNVAYRQGKENKTDGARIVLLENISGRALTLFNNIEYEDNLDIGAEIVIPKDLLVQTWTAFQKEKYSEDQLKEIEQQEQTQKLNLLLRQAQRIGIPVKQNNNTLELNCSVEELITMIETKLDSSI